VFILVLSARRCRHINISINKFHAYNLDVLWGVDPYPGTPATDYLHNGYYNVIADADLFL
jgi:hypothetical protein